jgi:hypothetical protein
VVNYLSGVAEKTSGSRWIALSVEDKLSVNDSVKTGNDSILDVATTLGSIRLLSNTEFHLNTLGSENQKVTVSGGDILVKLDKLSKKQSFTLDTPTVLAGVRGTQFWGRVNKADETGTFAVRDGYVVITR